MYFQDSAAQDSHLFVIQLDRSKYFEWQSN